MPMSLHKIPCRQVFEPEKVNGGSLVRVKSTKYVMRDEEKKIQIPSTKFQ